MKTPEFGQQTQIETPVVPELSHLKNPADAIMLCIDSPDDITEETINKVKMITRNGENIDFFKKTAAIVSEVNDQDKYSREYRNCTGTIVVGRSSADPTKNISLLSHQMPYELYVRDSFIAELKKKIEKLKMDSTLGTIDAIIIGGNELNDEFREYTDSIIDLNKIIKDSLGFDAIVAIGPNISPRGDRTGVNTNIYFDNSNRRLYVIRAEQPENITNKSFAPEDIEKEKEEWTKSLEKSKK
ncbi:MAG: hypothetical protein JWN37_623 [Candidatus Nomurabacteria bacterium]|nr:hypothetical protein [Candidatus Nomurabacteria bacterium]